MQAVVLAGGRGSRLGELTAHKPQPMIEILGKPVLEHLIVSARSADIDEFIICIGYRGDQIRDYFGDGKKLGAKITYIPQTGSGPEDTIFSAKPLLTGPQFCCLCADTVMPAYELERVVGYHFITGNDATFTLEYDDSISSASAKRVRVKGTEITGYSSSPKDPVLVYNFIMDTPFLDILARAAAQHADKAFCYAMDALAGPYDLAGLTPEFVNLNTPQDLQKAESLIRQYQDNRRWQKNGNN
jgi:NDP-sugar pyrophosphorylase family protein